MAVGWTQEMLSRKNEQDLSPLTGFENYGRNVSSNSIPKFVACGLGGPKDPETIVRKRKVRK